MLRLTDKSDKNFNKITYNDSFYFFINLASGTLQKGGKQERQREKRQDHWVKKIMNSMKLVIPLHFIS